MSRDLLEQPVVEQEEARDLLSEAPAETPMNYNGLDLLSSDKNINNNFIDRAKGMWNSMPRWKEIPKAAARDTEGILGSISGLVKMAGDVVKPNDEIRAQYENNGMDSSRIAFADKVGDWLIDIGGTAKDFWTEESMKGIEAPDIEVWEGTFLENPSWVRAFSLGAGALPSMGAAVIASVASGNPLVGASFLGLLEGEPIYAEAAEAGVDETKALGLFAAGAVIITATEYLPMERFMKGGSGRLIKDIVAGFFMEGTQEGIQQFASNLIRKYGIDDTISVFEGIVESVIAGGFAGAGMGGTTSKLLNRSVKKRIEKVEKQAEKLGMSTDEVDAMIGVVGDAIVAKNEEIEDVVVKHRDKVLADRKKAQEAELGKVEGEKKEADPLVAEALKYKSAEEFVEANDKYLYHNSSQRHFDDIKEQGILRPEEDSGDYSHGEQDIPDSVKRIYMSENKERALAFGGQVNSKYPETKSLLLRFKKSDLSGEVVQPKSVVGETGERWFLGDKVNPENIEYYDDGEWMPLTGKLKTKTKQQLTDIWEEAQKGIKEPKVKPLKTRLKEVSAKYKTKEAQIKHSIKEVQTEVIGMLEESDLSAKDKAKFISLIKNTQTFEQFEKAIPRIQERIARLETAQVVREAREKITKQLKTTKPTKQGAILKGKYDYETNTTFNALREYSKLTQEQAQEALDAMPEDSISKADLIKKRFLSLQANGSNASPALVKSVLADIQLMKTLGKDAKDEADMIRKLEQADKVINVRQGIKDIKGADKAGIRTKIVNAYRRGFTGIYDMLNSTIGKKLAEEYDPVLAELAKATAVNKRSIEGAKNISEALGIKKTHFAQTFNDMVSEEYNLTREDLSGEITVPVNRWDIIDIYNSIKNERTKENYYRVYGQEQVDTLVNKLTDEEKVAADYMQEEVQNNYEIQNERNVELTGRDLGKVDNYWPATSLIPLNLQQGMRIQGETPGSRKERAKGGVTPIPKNAYVKFNKSNVEAEHERFLSRAYENLKKVFANAGVKADFEKKYGKGVYKTLMSQIENLSLNSAQSDMDAIVNLMGKGLNNWVVAKIALSPSVFAKQLISVGNYMEVMPPAEWAKYFTKGIMSPKATFDFMWKNVPDLEARFNRGYSEALEHVMSESGRMGSKKQAWVNGMTFLVRTGDIGAIIYGGYPVIQEHLKNHPGDMKGAIDKFNLATQQAQQSGLKSTRSQFQNSNKPLVRLFLAFKNTANQYFRKQVNATISFYQGDISASQYAKTMAIYAVIQPALYGAAGFAMRGLLYGSNDEEDTVFAAMMEAMALNPFNAIPMINDIAKVAIRTMKGEKVWKAISMPLLDDINRAFMKMSKEDITIEEVMYELASLTAEVTTGAPVKTYERIYKKIFGEGESSGW